MNLFSVQGDIQNHRMLLKTQHFLYEALAVILFLGCKRGLLCFLAVIVEEGGRVFFP